MVGFRAGAVFGFHRGADPLDFIGVQKITLAS